MQLIKYLRLLMSTLSSNKMRDFLDKLGYALNRYYSKGGTKEIPYFSSICALAALLFLNTLMISGLLNINLGELMIGDLFGTNGQFFPKGEYWYLRLIQGFFILAPFLLVSFLLIPKGRINKIKMERRLYLKWIIGIFIYAILSLISLFLVVMYLNPS